MTLREAFNNALRSKTCAFCTEQKVAVVPAVGGYLPVCKWHTGL